MINEIKNELALLKLQLLYAVDLSGLILCVGDMSCSGDIKLESAIHYVLRLVYGEFFDIIDENL